MIIKGIIIAAAAAFSLWLLAHAAMADPVSVTKAGVSPAGQQAPIRSDNDSPIVLANFARHGLIRRDRVRDFRSHYRFRREFVEHYNGPDPKCYWNCRRSRSPEYCRMLAWNYSEDDCTPD
jgi:hypothetical protein